jgi:cation diffusion facilitator family transporter
MPEANVITESIITCPVCGTAKAENIIRQLKQVRGQIDSILGMFAEGRSCTDLAQQLRSVESIIHTAKRDADPGSHGALHRRHGRRAGDARVQGSRQIPLRRGMASSILAWFGPGNGHDHSHAGHSHDHGPGGRAHTHGVIDPSIATTERGIWAIKWSFVVLAITALLQFVVVFASGSVALLADTIHNVGDATTAIPLWIAFQLMRRPPTRTFNYGLGRVEDLAGMLIVFIILFSAIVAGYEAIDRLIHPQAIGQLWWVVAAGVIGFLGNEAVAVFRIGVGREIASAALVADGHHARTDGLTSLAVVAGAVGVWAGFPLADPIVGLLITIAIFGIVWQSARAVITRALDGVEPGLSDAIHHTAEHVPGIEIVSARARWIGHRLHADVAIAADTDQRVGEATQVALGLRNELMAHVPTLRTVTIAFALPDERGMSGGVAGAQGHGHHHAPEPFAVAGELAKGQLAIVDTPRGERIRLSVTDRAAGLQAAVVIERPDGPETLLLSPAPDDHHLLESTAAPDEPHEFSAVLILTSGHRTERLAFTMKEPANHHH